MQGLLYFSRHPISDRGLNVLHIQSTDFSKSQRTSAFRDVNRCFYHFPNLRLAVMSCVMETRVLMLKGCLTSVTHLIHAMVCRLLSEDVLLTVSWKLLCLRFFMRTKVSKFPVLGPARTRAPVGTSARLMYSSGSNSTTPSVDSSKFEVARMVVVDELQSVALKVGLSNDSDVANDTSIWSSQPQEMCGLSQQPVMGCGTCITTCNLIKPSVPVRRDTTIFSCEKKMAQSRCEKHCKQTSNI